MKDGIVYEDLFSADFRIESLHLDRVLADLVKWIRTMPTHVRLVFASKERFNSPLSTRRMISMLSKNKTRGLQLGL